MFMRSDFAALRVRKDVNEVCCDDDMLARVARLMIMLSNSLTLLCLCVPICNYVDNVLLLPRRQIKLAKAKFTCSQAKTRVDFPDGADNMLRLIFTISIADVAGPYANGDFTFFVEIPKTYPFHGTSGLLISIMLGLHI